MTLPLCHGSRREEPRIQLSFRSESPQKTNSLLTFADLVGTQRLPDHPDIHDFVVEEAGQSSILIMPRLVSAVAHVVFRSSSLPTSSRCQFLVLSETVL